MGLIEQLRENDRELYLPLLGRAADAIEALCGYAEHDPDCENNGAYPGSCTCGFSHLMAEIRGDD